MPGQGPQCRVHVQAKNKHRQQDLLTNTKVLRDAAEADSVCSATDFMERVPVAGESSRSITYRNHHNYVVLAPEVKVIK